MHWKHIQAARLYRLFFAGFTAMDIANLPANEFGSEPTMGSV